MKTAIIKDGLVENVIVGEVEGGIEILPGEQAHIGYGFDPVTRFEQPIKEVIITEKDYSNAAQSVLDAQARSMGYDSILTAISYEGDGTAFSIEAVALKAWRSAVWVFAYAQLAQVEAGEIVQPTVDEFKASLPAFPGV